MAVSALRWTSSEWLSAGRLCGLLLACAVPLAALAATDDDITVDVVRRGEVIVVDVQAPVEATQAQAWAVLTDYEHMAAFISNLKVSAVLNRAGNRLQVQQAGEARKGPLRFAFETVRAIELIPEREIRSTLISGDFKFYEMTTQVVSGAGKTVIRNHGEYIPKRWVPPGIGPAMIAAETRKQYAEIRAEVIRRKAQSGDAPP
ncbi:MAG: SRPBCC family protein [Pseudomonadota bacterium]|nr:SRPBCC family protein [Pseudomonadota bacterium]